MEAGPVPFVDLIHGPQSFDVSAEAGDFGVGQEAILGSMVKQAAQRLSTQMGAKLLGGATVGSWKEGAGIISDLIRAALILGLVFVTRLEQIYVLFFLVSTVSSFFGPSQSVTLRTLVPVNGLMSANALMSQAFYTMRIIAPAAAGLLVYWLGYNSCFYLDSASFLFSAAMLSTIAP